MTTVSSLLISGLKFKIHLGWHAAERRQKQVVLADIGIQFANVPQACFTDDLVDTFCYSTLVERILKELADQHFHLIEHLTYKIHQIIAPMIPENAQISVCITKHPEIPGLTGGVSFNYRDQ